jgi:hypothetical protein
MTQAVEPLIFGTFGGVLSADHFRIDKKVNSFDQI